MERYPDSGSGSQARWSKLHFRKDLGQGKRYAERGKLDLGAHADGFFQAPLTISLPDELFDPRFLLVDQQVFAAAWDLAIMFELLTTIVCFGRIGQHFNYNRRIQQSILLVVEKTLLATNHGNIRISEQASGFDLHTQISVISCAPASL